MMAGIFKDPQLNQIVSEFYARFVQVILESRVPAHKSGSSQGSASTSRPTAEGRGLNVSLGKRGADIYRTESCCNNMQDPMVIDILFSKQGNNSSLEGFGQKMGHGAGKTSVNAPTGIVVTASGLEQPIILERWTVEYVQHSSKLAMAERKTDLQIEKGTTGQHLRGIQRFGSLGNDGRGGFLNKMEMPSTYNVVERKMALLLRSVYCTTRLLPAYHLFRLFCMLAGKCQFKLSYRLTSSPCAPAGNNKDMTNFCLASIKLGGGYLQVSVTHRQKNPSMEREKFAICPQIITDYIGRATSLPSKQVQTESRGSLRSLPSAAQRLSSFKFDNLQLHQAPIKNAEATQTISMDCGDFTLVEDEDFQCPFAINDDRAKSVKLRSVKSELGSTSREPPQASRGPLAAYLAFEKTAAPLSGAYQPKKDAANSLKELQMYIDFRDSLSSRRTYQRKE